MKYVVFIILMLMLLTECSVNNVEVMKPLPTLMPEMSIYGVVPTSIPVVPNSKKAENKEVEVKKLYVSDYVATLTLLSTIYQDVSNYDKYDGDLRDLRSESENAYLLLKTMSVPSYALFAHDEYLKAGRHFSNASNYMVDCKTANLNCKLYELERNDGQYYWNLGNNIYSDS